MKVPLVTPPRPDLYANGLRYTELITNLLRDGKLKTTPVKLFPGLESVEEGVEYMRAGKVSGEKVTFKII